MEDEPLSSQFPVDYLIRTTPVQFWLRSQLDDSCSEPSMAPLETAFESVYADLSRKSRVPSGAFAVHDQSTLKQQVLAAGALLSFCAPDALGPTVISRVVVGAVMDDFMETVAVPRSD
jgi:hypothetical protein